ncbi:polysaccharide deacetylase family protein [Paenibacillaceae bacterium WGS1546]|uniref:polysaccharide deacetylase family protein n=1 Tax=Cohnella sp. WGS1546 TaxID=3366810 RepID=UPI00372D87AD
MQTADMITKIPTNERLIAFTFDDGPNPTYTPQLLDIFRAVGGKATFFMIGMQIEANPHIAAAVHAEGHEIGNHTDTHPYLTKLRPEEACTELERAEERIHGITGQSVRVFRPPFFDMDDSVLSIAREKGYLCIGAVNPETRDWEMPGVDYILTHTRNTIADGSVLLFHDGYGDRSQTVEAVRMLVAELTAEGYRFVTVSELLA